MSPVSDGNTLRIARTFKIIVVSINGVKMKQISIDLTNFECPFFHYSETYSYKPFQGAVSNATYGQ